MMTQLKKSVEVEKMPSVRVRPTLRVELKHRVLKCKIDEEDGSSSKKKKSEPIDINSLNQQVLQAMRRSKRANMGGENEQVNLIESCQDEISNCRNLDEIRRSLETAPMHSFAKEIQSSQQISVRGSAQIGSQMTIRQ